MATGVGGGVQGAFHFDRVMSGSLLAGASVMNPVTGKTKQNSLGGFTNEIVSWGKGVGALKQSMYYFIAEGENAGAGRFSLGMAQAAAFYIRGGMKDPKLRKLRYKGPTIPPRHEDYQDWVDQIAGFKFTSVMTLTGWSADFFGVLRIEGQGVSLGINPNAETPSPVVGEVPLQYQDFTSNISEYMDKHEHGTHDFTQRPLMAGLVLGYLQDTDKTWANAFERYLNDTFWVAKKKAKKEVSLSDFGTSKGQAAIATSSQISNVYKDQADALDLSAFEWEQVDDALQWASDKFAKGIGDNENKRLFVLAFRPKLKALGLTNGQVIKTIRACFRGNYEDLV